MTEADANAEAARIAKRWEHILRHWMTLYQRTLTALGEPFADIPHWREALLKTNELTDEQIREYQDQQRTSDEIAEAYGPIYVNDELVETGVTLNGVYLLFVEKLKGDTANDEHQKSTEWTNLKNLRGAMAFFDRNMPMSAFDANTIRDAKSKMKLKPRTIKNYLGMMKRMLVWFYDSPFGRLFREDRPTADQWDSSTFVRKTKPQIRTYDFAELGTLLATSDDEQRLYTMLALNAGMTQADIGRLTLSEINLTEGYVFWDREKQPENDFRVRHNLWPETMRLVHKFIQPINTKRRLFTDYRRKLPVEIDCSSLAFTNVKGEPLYRVRPSGKATDLLGKIFCKNTVKDASGNSFHFMNLRKSANQILKDLLREKAEGETHGQILAITEISDTFLSHKSDDLQNRYDIRGVSAYGLMNNWLAQVGDFMRTKKVFESVK